MQGVSFVLYAADKNGKQTRIGGQTDASLSFGAEMVDTTSKDHSGWASDMPAGKSWEISSSAFLAFDAGHEILEDAFMNSQLVDVQLRTPSNSKWVGKAYIENLDYSFGVKDIAQFDFTLKGQGPLCRVYQDEEESPSIDAETCESACELHGAVPPIVEKEDTEEQTENTEG